MKKLALTLLLLACLPITTLYAQKKLTADELILTIKDQWKQDNQTIFVQKIIELENYEKDAIYNKILEFLTNTYKDAAEVIQVKEKENGLIVGKGNSSFYVNQIFAGSAVKQTIWHIFKAEIKDNRVRITISIDTVNWSTEASRAGGVYISAKNGEFPITACYPIGVDDSRKKRSGYVFYYAVSDIINLANSCEQFLKSKSPVTANDNW